MNVEKPLVATLLAPALRRWVDEEQILTFQDRSEQDLDYRELLNGLWGSHRRQHVCSKSKRSKQDPPAYVDGLSGSSLPGPRPVRVTGVAATSFVNLPL